MFEKFHFPPRGWSCGFSAPSSPRPPRTPGPWAAGPGLGGIRPPWTYYRPEPGRRAGNYVWASMVWDMRIISTEANAWKFQLDPKGRASFIHVTNPSDWEVVPYEAAGPLAPTQGIFDAGSPDCIVLQQTGPAISLIKACIQRAGHGLNQVDMVRIARHLGIACEDDSAYNDLLKAIALNVSDNDNSFAELVMKMDKATQKTVSELIDDPFFELAFDMMNEDDKGEFPDVSQELQKKRARHREAHDREERKRRKMAGGRGTPRKPTKDSPGRPDSPSPGPAGGAAQAPPPSASSNSGPPGNAAPAPEPEPVPAATRDNPAAEAKASPKAKASPTAKAKARLPRGAAGIPWGRDFVIAETTKYGEPVAVTATCKCHTFDGKRCNKWVTLGPEMDLASAEHRIKEWCIKGYDLPDIEGGCKLHMKPRPRNWKDSNLRPLADLERLLPLKEAAFVRSSEAIFTSLAPAQG